MQRSPACEATVPIAAASLWRIMLGPVDGAAAAQVARDGVAARGYGDAPMLPAD